MKQFLLSLLSLAFAGSALADVQMVIKDNNGRSSTFSSNGQKARVDDAQRPGFIIIDYGSAELFMVDTQRKQIMKTSIGEQSAAVEAKPLSISLKDKGGGQKIAGYETRKHELVAEGQSCGYVYASRKLLRNSDVRAIFESMRSLQQFSRGLMGGMSGMLSVCQRAGMQLADAIETSGAPLKVVDETGKSVSEVTRVDTNKKFAASHYDLPSGLAVVDMTGQIDQAAQQAGEMIKKLPEMDKLMDQMQEDGQMTEAMKQQLKQLQQMMEQLQQQ